MKTNNTLPIVYKTVYNYEYVDKTEIPEEFYCTFCKYPLIEATTILCNCVNLYCYSCINNLITACEDSNEKIKCYNEDCSYIISSETKKHLKKYKLLDKMLDEFVVACFNRKKGCPWEGIRSDIERHLKNCFYIDENSSYYETKIDSKNKEGNNKITKGWWK